MNMRRVCVGLSGCVFRSLLFFPRALVHFLVEVQLGALLGLVRDQGLVLVSGILYGVIASLFLFCLSEIVPPSGFGSLCSTYVSLLCLFFGWLLGSMVVVISKSDCLNTPLPGLPFFERQTLCDASVVGVVAGLALFPPRMVLNALVMTALPSAASQCTPVSSLPAYLPPLLSGALGVLASLTYPRLTYEARTYQQIAADMVSLPELDDPDEPESRHAAVLAAVPGASFLETSLSGGAAAQPRTRVRDPSRSVLE